MSVTRRQEITQADVDALAALANTRLGAYLASQSSPPDFIYRDFEFSYMDSEVLPPTSLAGVVNLGSGDYGTGGLVSIRVYSYKIISSRRHYSKKFASACIAEGATFPSNIEWTWTPPSGGADGYIMVWRGGQLFEEPITGSPGFEAYWKDVSTAGFVDNGYFNETLAEDTGILAQNFCPVESGQWRRELERIKITANAYSAADESWVVSGPWCCSVGTRLVSISGTFTRFKEIEFWYAADDHSGDVPVTAMYVLGTSGAPVSIPDDISGTTDSAQFTLNFNSVTGTSVVTGRISCGRSVGGAGWTHSISGSGTVVSETWTEVSATVLALDFVFNLPQGTSSMVVNVTSLVGVVNTPGFFYADATTLVDTITPTDETIVHPSSAGKKIDVSGSFDPNDPVMHFMGGAGIKADTIDVGINGVWVAKTLPVFCVNTYLESKIPTGGVYSGDGTAPDTTSQRGMVPGLYDDPGNPPVTPVVPAVGARPSMWPVFRDTDMLTWRVYPGKEQDDLINDYLVPFFANGNFISFGSQTILAGEHRSYLFFPPDNFEAGKIEAEGTTLPIYFSQVDYPDPDNPSTYDGVVPSPLRMPSDYNPTPGSGVLYTIKNNTADSVTFNLRTTNFTTLDGAVGGWWPGPVPVFFYRTDENRGAFERYSYNFTTPKSDGLGIQSEIPLSGYCIYEIKVQRASTGATFRTVPAAGQPELDVSIGLMRGTTNDDVGTFEELLSVTIPEDDASITVTVFWPVLDGAALVYQCSEVVEIFAAVNFQPEYIAQYVVTSSHPSYSSQKWGTYSGLPIASTSVLRFRNESFRAGSGFTEGYVTHHAAADIYNDIEAVLNVL